MISITIHSADKRWKGHSAVVRKAAKAALKSELQSLALLRGGAKGVSLAILLTDDDEVQLLNRDYRGKDKPTNVLSFPDGAEDEEGSIYLGDIAMAYETIAREAKEQGKSFEAHLTHLVMHGVLHLLGYDHIKPKEAKIMEALEIKLLNAMGIANPYESE